MRRRQLAMAAATALVVGSAATALASPATADAANGIAQTVVLEPQQGQTTISIARPSTRAADDLLIVSVTVQVGSISGVASMNGGARVDRARGQGSRVGVGREDCLQVPRRKGAGESRA